MTGFLEFMLLQCIAPGNSWLGRVSLKRLQNYMGNKNKGNESKIIFGGFNFTMDKNDRYGGNKR